MSEDISIGSRNRSASSAAGDRAYRLRCLNLDCFAMPLLKPRNFQGFLITGPHSGTHWVKWMLSHAIAHRYGVPPPRYYDNISSNDIIGHPRHAPVHSGLPRIASTHSVAPYALQWRWLRRCVDFPPYAVLLRDIRDVLVSYYEKWRHRYNVSFSEYVHGDPRGNTYITDVWNYIRFMNRWGDIASRYPAETLVMTYEEVQADTLVALSLIAAHFGLILSGEDLAAGVAAGSKEHMLRHRDPQIAERAVLPDGEGTARFSQQDLAVLQDILDRHLRHDFGYGYFSRPRGFQAHGVESPA